MSDDHDANHRDDHRSRRYDDEYEPEYADGPSSNDKSMALLAHVLVFVIGILAPIIIFFAFGEKSAFVKRHAKESLNFQISVIFHSMVLLLIAGMGALAGYLLVGPGFPVIVGYMVAALPFTLGYVIWEIVVLIKASLAANRGQEYRYPLTIRLF